MSDHGARARGRRFAWGTLFATCMAVCMVPMGCGASDEYAAAPEQGTQPTLPASTVEALQACAKEGAGRLQHNAYEIGFDVTLDDDGGVRRVTATGHRLEDASLEGCMIDALRAMNPEFLPEISRGFPAHARGVVGSVSVLPPLAELAPVVIGASGVTIVVTVALIVVIAAVALTDRDPTEEECKEEKIRATLDCKKWLAMPNPPRERIGPRMNLEDCIASNIHEACGGKKVERDKSPQYDKSRPGRRF
jgi:hypothetical protein